MQSEPTPRPTLKEIISATARVTGVPTCALLQGRTTRVSAARARYAGFLACRSVTPPYTQKEIGEAFGGRHRTAVIHGVRMAGDADIGDDIQANAEAILEFAVNGLRDRATAKLRRRKCWNSYIWEAQGVAQECSHKRQSRREHLQMFIPKTVEIDADQVKPWQKNWTVGVNRLRHINRW